MKAIPLDSKDRPIRRMADASRAAGFIADAPTVHRRAKGRAVRTSEVTRRGKGKR